MKALTLASLLTVALTVSLSASIITPTNVTQHERRLASRVEQHSKGGRWYFAANGHAVYCYGPVMTLPQANGDLQKVATFCRDGQAVVPLKD
jgi:hypothetical protein